MAESTGREQGGAGEGLGSPNSAVPATERSPGPTDCPGEGKAPPSGFVAVCVCVCTRVPADMCAGVCTYVPTEAREFARTQGVGGTPRAALCSSTR